MFFFLLGKVLLCVFYFFGRGFFQSATVSLLTINNMTIFTEKKTIKIEIGFTKDSKQNELTFCEHIENFVGFEVVIVS